MSSSPPLFKPLNLQVDSDLTASAPQTVRDSLDNPSSLALNTTTVEVDAAGTIAIHGQAGVASDQKLHFGIPGQSGDGEWLQNAVAARDNPNFGVACFAGGGERLRVLGSNGNVGIATAEPQSTLHVEGDVRIGGSDSTSPPSPPGPSDSSHRLIFDDSDGVTPRTKEWIRNLGATDGYGLAFYAGGKEQVRIGADGKVGILTSKEPVADIELGGTVAMPDLPDLPTTGIAELIIDADGNLAPQLSSVRLKDSVEALDVDFHQILALEPKSFVYKSSGQRGIGYTAEDVDAREELRELVTYDAEGRPLGVHYKMMPVYLLEVVKEQQEQIVALRAELAELRGRIDAERSPE